MESRRSGSDTVSVLRGMGHHIPLMVYIFLVVYSPPVGPAPALTKVCFLILAPLVVSMHYSLKRYPGIGSLLSRSGASLFVLCVTVGSFYIYSVRSLTGQELETLADTRIVQNLTPLLVLINVVIIVDLLQRNGFFGMQAFEVLLFLAGFQGAFAVVSIFVPALKGFSNYLYAAGGSENEFVTAVRVYGISSDFTYGTPIYHGALAGVAVYFAVVCGRKYARHLPLILTVTLLNGRTGLLVFVVLAAVSIVFGFFKRGNIVGALAGGAALAALLYGALRMLEAFVPGTYKFVMSFVRSTGDLVLEDRATGNYSVLTDEIQMVPEGLALIFGTGLHLFDGAQGFRTDIGFTNDLFSGGLLYIIIVYVPFLLFVFQWRVGSLLLSMELAIVFIVANLKGEFFHSTVAMFIVFFVVVHQGATGDEKIERQQSRAIRSSESTA